MHKVLMWLLLVLDIILIPVWLLYYMIFAIDLLCSCINSKEVFKDEIKDFNKVVIEHIKNRIDVHKEHLGV